MVAKTDPSAEPIYRFGGALSDGSETGLLTSLSPYLSFLAQAD